MVIIGVLILMLVGCTGVEQTKQQDTTQNTTDVLATVNGESIKSEEVKSIQQSMMQQGLQLSEQDALEQLIGQKVLYQAAKKTMQVTVEQAEAAMTTQLAQQNVTLADYKQQLQMQGIDYEKQLENVKQQIAIQSYLDTSLQNIDLNVTDEEANVFYEQYKQQAPEEVPAYEQLKPQIVVTLQQQKQQDAITNLITGLKESAEIEYR